METQQSRISLAKAIEIGSIGDKQPMMPVSRPFQRLDSGLDS